MASSQIPAAVTIEYHLAVDVTDDKSYQGLKPDAIVSYPIPNAPNSSQREYYANLGVAVQKATIELGQTLTEWRDAVGDREKGREEEAKKAKAEDSDEEVDE